MTATKPVVGYAGMTHLGLNSAVASAERGFDMVCFDPDESRIAPLQKGELPVVEPDLPELLAKNRDRITFTSDPADLAACDLVYVAPDVPTDDAGASDTGPLEALIATVDAAMRADAVMVILSQVSPGFTRPLPRPGAVKYYQVETLIFGRAIERAMYPERFIVGCDDPDVPLPPALATYLAAFDNCPILPMRYESAELAKISINVCLVASVSVANTLGELCEKIGADWSEIVPALKLDRRIGPYSYLAPGLGIAGGNLERDLATVCRFSDRYGTDSGFIRAMIANSQYRRHWPLRRLHEVLLSRGADIDPVVAVWGLAYKQDTHSTKNSPSLAFLSALGPFRVQAFDPVVKADPAFHPRIEGAESALAALEGAEVLAIMTPWSAFREIAPAEIAARMSGRLVLDPYAVLDRKAAQAAGLDLQTLGVDLGAAAPARAAAE
ncbi:nucleotide sugar dehydrogenase [Marinibaculum pumilum]|uniref:UDP-glucose 6-dehydrogenase n=1 Tax=Marinibaculum pumilum TaxID=1766165 RepID=A0ABV7KY69_9PROT